MKKPREGIRVVLGVSGSIAAYKSVELVRYLMSRGCQVRAILTDSGARFVTPFVLETITRHPVTTSFWNETQPGAIGHIELADWADVVVVAPATADTIAKLRHGFGESPLLAVALATRAPLVVAPAMNARMYEHPATQGNLEELRARGVIVVEPEAGQLACGWVGRGRLADKREIYATLQRSVATQDLAGKRVVVTAGPTREAVDPVRFLSNRSSGKMGIALAREAFRRGAEVTLIHGPIAGAFLPRGVTCVGVSTAAEMLEAVVSKTFAGCSDVLIMAAAVADYRPASSSPAKIKKGTAGLSLELVANPDILRLVGEKRGDSPSPLIIGFAVETGSPAELVAEARRKMISKSADMIVGNLAGDAFDKDTNRVWIVRRDGCDEEVATASKGRVARRILDAIVSLQELACRKALQH